ncbi:mixed lineage kinase domain-like protein [Mastacembelus armatus]|uniref:Mixed lineage kinase domain like pseudokinase n=1 Tax=Mastacembelus armatus TaxID=205130 RepID=A0A3Q3NCV6_9TELE|nr:mixed lineage kinase domain-like protein [Mastacembelus armatus]
MDFIEPILSAASLIYSLVEQVKANKKRCHRISKRVQALEMLVKSFRDRDMTIIQTSSTVGKTLQELSITLESAQQLMKKYTSANWVERVLKSSSHGEEFDSVNDRLNDAYQALSLALQVETGNRVFEAAIREKEDELDRKQDDNELGQLLLKHLKAQEEKVDQLKTSVEKVVEMLNKPSITNEVIRMIRLDELKYDKIPKEPFMKTSTSEVYKGQYRGFPVAIKRYMDPLNTSPSQVRNIFNKEVETMKRFESPNILRMFGICVQDEDGPNPHFLIIMEYCAKGNLRQVLDSERKLSWAKKARMCLDAAQGLYRLHQTEEKSKVHGSITSSKFLVDEGYRVKLGGFELAKTETSLKKPTKEKESRSLCYSCPQILDDINHRYSKECEIYSFGIVLWEVTTRKKPFDGCTSTEIYQKVCKEKFQELLPDDCPAALRDLINACRDNDSFQRPSAGVLVDKLQSVVTELEEQ